MVESVNFIPVDWLVSVAGGKTRRALAVEVKVNKHGDIMRILLLESAQGRAAGTEWLPMEQALAIRRNE